MSRKVLSIVDEAAGWISIILNMENKQFVLTSVSYTTDAIGDLVRWGLQIAAGAAQANLTFDREPAVWRMHAESLFNISDGAGAVQISVYEPADIHAPTSEDDLVFRGDCGALDLSAAILSEAKAFLDKPETGWTTCPYPKSAIHALEAALASFAR